MVLEKTDRVFETEYSASVQGCQTVELRPQVEGQITEILIEEGQKVCKGQKLFVIDQVPYLAALEAAAAELEIAKSRLGTAELNYESVKMLRESDVVQDFDLKSAFNNLQEAKAQLALAQAQHTDAARRLSYTEICSPVDGVAGMINYRVGSLVSSSISTPLLTVCDDSVIYIYFSLNESRVLDLISEYGSVEKFVENSPELSLKMSNGALFPYKGRISVISGLVSSQSGAVRLRADFPNPQALLRSGGSAKLIVPSFLHDCIVIPQSATYEIQDRKFVYKVVEGKAVAVPVELYPLSDGREYVVTKGLAEKDEIIAEGAALVKEGVKVKKSVQ